MASMNVYPSKVQYHKGIRLLKLSMEDRVAILIGKHLAETLFEGRIRRDRQPTVRHSRAVALKADELGLSIYAQVLSWDHDLPEDCNVTPEEIGEYFGDMADRIAFGLDALTHREGEPVEEYFGRIIEASKTEFEIVVVKLIDRWHFHLCPYGGSKEKEAAKAIETLTSFKNMSECCRQYIPKHFLLIYDELLKEVLGLATAKLTELSVALP